MYRFIKFKYLLLLFSIIFFTISWSQTSSSGANSHSQLVEFFKEWREFVRPQTVNSVPDYSKAAMVKQQTQLAIWQQRLAAFKKSGWTIEHQIDWYIIWAEMNGLDFEHRVKKPWERDPAFYIWFYPDPTDVPEREASNIYGNIELHKYSSPLAGMETIDIAERLTKIAAVYQQARINLTGNARDLWVSGIRSIRQQSENLVLFAKRMEKRSLNLSKIALEAKAESDDFASWLEQQLPKKGGSSGVGKENYTWNLKKVHLMPYTWEEELLLIERELARAHSSLRLEENRNRDLPGLSKIDNAGDYGNLLNQAVSEYMEFLEEEEILPIKDYMEGALRERIGSFIPKEQLPGFFSEIIYREPLVMRSHHYHWIDLGRIKNEPNKSPIRQTATLFNIFDSRAEGMATGMEEMMMHAGLLDDKPRARELIWILLAQRCARGIGALYQHSLEMTLNEAAQFASKWTPWGLLPATGKTILNEEQFYLRQPAYGTSYVIGKIQIEMLLAEYARQKSTSFVLKEFIDDFNGAGIIPVSLIYWELTGDKSMLEAALAD